MSICFRLSGVAMLARMSVSPPTSGLRHSASWQLLKYWSSTVQSRSSDSSKPSSNCHSCPPSALSSVRIILRMLSRNAWHKTR